MLEQSQIERILEVRAQRDQARASEALANIEQAARTEENLMPRIVEAVEAHASLGGEISDRMRFVFGEYSASNFE
jgi:methylmalonyl-CoA mutase N-terminal domain/subunit